MSRILRAFKAENKFTRHLGQISVEKFYVNSMTKISLLTVESRVLMCVTSFFLSLGHS